MKRNKNTEVFQPNKLEYFEINKEMRRYTFEKIVEYVEGQINSEHSFKEKYVTAFDISYSLGIGSSAYFLCEILQISLGMIETMQLSY